jgi:hypothetical protein
MFQNILFMLSAFLYCAGHEDMRALVSRHVQGLKDLSAHISPAPTLVLMVESNLGLEAAHIANMLKDDTSVISIRETGKEGRFGVLTTQGRKMEFVALLEQLLMQSSVAICKRVVSDDDTAALNTLKRQLQQYRMVSSESNCVTVFNQSRVTYSGKVSENGKVAPSALQDDLCIALQLAAFWSSYVIQRRCKFLDYDRFYK